VRWEKFLKHSGWSVCRQSQSVSFCQDVKVRFSDVCFFGVLSFFRLAYNVFGLCVRAGFGAQNCQPALNLNRSTKLQVCTSPRLTQNPCYSQWFLSFLVCRYMFFLAIFFYFCVVCKVVVTKFVKFFFCT
jgi:hypothetical protein